MTLQKQSTTTTLPGTPLWPICALDWNDDKVELLSDDWNPIMEMDPEEEREQKQKLTQKQLSPERERLRQRFGYENNALVLTSSIVQADRAGAGRFAAVLA